MFLNLSILNPFSFLSQRAELTSDKDMYLDNSSIEDASGVYPIDDDDYASASGSGRSGCFHTRLHSTCLFPLSFSPSLPLSLLPAPSPPPPPLTPPRTYFRDTGRCIVVNSVPFGVRVPGCEFCSPSPKP